MASVEIETFEEQHADAAQEWGALHMLLDWDIAAFAKALADMNIRICASLRATSWSVLDIACSQVAARGLRPTFALKEKAGPSDAPQPKEMRLR